MKKNLIVEKNLETYLRKELGYGRKEIESTMKCPEAVKFLLEDAAHRIMTKRAAYKKTDILNLAKSKELVSYESEFVEDEMKADTRDYFDLLNANMDLNGLIPSSRRKGFVYSMG